MNLQLLC